MLRLLPMPTIDELASHVDKVEVATGRDVFQQGDHGDRFYVIEHGEAEVFGDGRLIRTLREGEGFGEIALLHDMLRTTTIRARTPLRLLTLDRRHFLSGHGLRVERARGGCSGARPAERLQPGALRRRLAAVGGRGARALDRKH
ncbi:MAG TPA: cyclic nucleotide-binding domain-containing protein [Gaiellaceae bacterium]|nr:cyclic nucleotide-binding domain-containing protein [Gaiellaceae bacterium]